MGQCTTAIIQANWSIAVRIFGLFEALVVLLIVIGDVLGGTLYAVSVLV